MDSFEAAKQHFMQGLEHLQKKNYTDAAQAFTSSLVLLPARPSTLTNLAAAQIKLGQPQLAADSASQALQLEPDNAQAWLNLGLARHDLGDYSAALSAYAHALNLQADWVEALSNQAVTLLELRRHEEAKICLETCLRLQPDDAPSAINLSEVLNDLGQLDAALSWLDRAVHLAPTESKYLARRGSFHLKQRNIDAALDNFEQAFKLDPDAEYVLGRLLYARLHRADWKHVARLTQDIARQLGLGKKVINPFDAQAILDSEPLLQTCARMAVASLPKPAQVLEHKPMRHQPDRQRMRIGYLCGEFNEHATSVLMAGVFEQHDPTRFEIIALDNSRNDGSALRHRVLAAFARHIPIREMGTADVARLIHDLGLDILVDLNAHTGDHRAELMAWRAAPVQVNFLAYPGTFGCDSVDYILADPTVIPPSSFQHYDEKVVHLPHTYQANDHHRTISPQTPSRRELGLPEQAMVYCCFNNPYKIHPDTFDSWCRILNRVPGSVLWLLQESARAADGLCEQAQQRGIDPSRLVFAPRAALADHLARHRQADLFLDTLPYNAHTTCSDALWAGLPVLTLKGQTFAGRVAASLLQAIGLPELITETRQAYEDLAVQLGQSDRQRKELQRKLEAHRLTQPLFNTPLFTRHLETAYTMMHQRRLTGLPPDHFKVPA